MKILAFAASNNKKSINRQLAAYTAGLHSHAQVEVIDINDYELPIFSDEREAQLGKPELAKQFFNKIGAADAIIISFAEHNGSYTAAYKNLFDWASRISKEVFQNKPALFLSTSPGPGGAASVLAVASQSAKYFSADLKASISVPSFYDNFDVETNQLTNHELNNQLLQAVGLLG
ncbi:MAG: NAD(P)H-dependent oxidoreductase [Gammaproteobacteria bacterium]|nr:NAD(P)H-dependent oxidoreductase [Gammaproteobacteria bacterium]